ncbi:bifunctional glutamate N-acetyltransferase/amino-acid acetyltransferase ArgJ [Oleiharenicola lentus]|jgi:glutamate N-acetyltransferase/amino-acid N-acetyltransferase|uniref:Arginine biosynthesis bifunctional protein ArgJ n=1 Tax=Oleiharenicola lentus TaxID=2508720 RepID=A0A4V1M696_9BACT|nr:bifunctional glutamate N-acetyltransferase/amino-acid acetyltransferase ArgJ [Oleiharenicola lentus]RXK54629.1 bifunctional glutamate N-acetyltransferase/amino-acid acetyltransferase ArgJ [Oleiharenicola lentus]
MSQLTVTPDSAGITDVPGFEAAGVACDIRDKNDLKRLDLALLFSLRPCTAAGTFTTNQVKAAPVLLCQKHLANGGPFHGIVANSGNANACTGPEGLKDAQLTATRIAASLNLKPEQFFVCSTGRIGQPLPMPKLLKGLERTVTDKGRTAEHGTKAANAILTSDTKPKTVTVSFTYDGKKHFVSGIAKGAGMIQPNMATMLAFLATDFSVPRSFLQKTLSEAVAGTFNCITVDGDMSTNDTVLMLANGHSGVSVGDKSPRELRVLFAEAVWKACEALAEKIVSDGEKITKVVELKVLGAASTEDAEKVARAIGNSLLVKSSWYGEDPNWGRLADAAGYAKAKLVEAKLDILYNDTPAMTAGKPHPELKPKWKEIVKAKRFTITLNLHLGKASFRLLASDLTEGYVNYNKSE